jgi:hypothetical protein
MEPHWVYSHFRTKKDSLDNFFIIECKKQICKAKNDWSNCYDIGWIVKTNAQGKELWNKDLAK